MNIMEICVGGNWLCARNGPWRFPGNFLIWILGGICSGFVGCKFPDVPHIGNLDGPLVGKWNGKGLGA